MENYEHLTAKELLKLEPKTALERALFKKLREVLERNNNVLCVLNDTIETLEKTEFN